MSRSYPSRALDLRPKEIQYLTMLANGHSAREAAALMGVSSRTAEEYSWEARNKLGAVTIVHAVAIAVREGLIK